MEELIKIPKEAFHHIAHSHSSFVGH